MIYLKGSTLGKELLTEAKPQAEPKPLSYSEMNERRGTRHWWTWLFDWCEWVSEWIAYGLSNWALISVLEYLGKFAIVVGLISYFLEAPTRKKQSEYEAWKIVTSNKGGMESGGRIQALQDLNNYGEELCSVDLHRAFLRGVKLQNAVLIKANLTLKQA